MCCGKYKQPQQEVFGNNQSEYKGDNPKRIPEKRMKGWFNNIKMNKIGNDAFKKIKTQKKQS